MRRRRLRALPPSARPGLRLRARSTVLALTVLALTVCAAVLPRHAVAADDARPLAAASTVQQAASPSAAVPPAASQPVVPQAVDHEPIVAVPADLSGLLAGMRSSVGVVAAFTETRELALLSSPLESAGTIYFVPPDRMVRVVTRPGRSRLVVDGSRARFEDETGAHDLDLGASPVARQLVDSFVVLFRGDEPRLRELYDCTYEAGGSSWSLRLVPRSTPLDRMVASMHLVGTGARIDRMETLEPDGDRTVAVFGDTDVQHRFSREELSRLFAPAAGQ